ncbi:hypothetical protein CN544_16100 [Bacillus toyonensis]|uniref:hypothetical protein n=1 Tax=Bacillus cereus group TaxID=86661 RepID=UPI000BF02B54|nr:MULTISPECIES: hypothetical protein [Bacillus cereus group]PEY32829.1 hypothetical protein CN354_20480 [Bacillus cereus]MCU5518619.1 hypothetical protein [Bacillus wiedmannii]PEN36914.1 hypothetical protein CN543_11360 [Bacillus toyonensis]PEN80744.1 hypothetical protein CN544_16100 [Bacillus toyonensis]PEO07930.1 hypothetical protein CN561_00185 [Bacillus toyonensis]
MNKWAILSLLSVPYALLTIINEDTLEIGGSANIFWKIGLFAPLIGVLFSAGASKTYQRVMLAIFNLGYYFGLYIYMLYTF